MDLGATTRGGEEESSQSGLTRSVSISNIFVDILYSSVAPSTITLDTGPGDDLEGPYARPMQTKIGGMGQIGAL